MTLAKASAATKVPTANNVSSKRIAGASDSLIVTPRGHPVSRFPGGDPAGQGLAAVAFGYTRQPHTFGRPFTPDEVSHHLTPLAEWPARRAGRAIDPRWARRRRCLCADIPCCERLQ